MDFTSNAVITEAPTFVHLGLPDANALDEFNTFGIPTTIVRRLMDSSYWSAPGHVFGGATAVVMSGIRQ